ncbi:hypothetical protein I5R65_10205 [Herbaspirillum sp. AP02]|uniref:hypothetical protein n=1 Tax=unclassified Herbaspirillum TaxID=2624150 RepID=UPI0015DADF2A|nr:MULTISPECIES: hypothetical protein [unclassified Herbaspirillum]MBG7619835.1 hypothetical protein [Herbaspirillum sp. AP02]NZD69906.1 hypothetical protein [Herbaspirillum sp. AP21]
MHPSSYSTDDYWKRYQVLLPEYARIGDHDAPAESYFSWRDADIHLDRFACDTSPLLFDHCPILLLHWAGDR